MANKQVFGIRSRPTLKEWDERENALTGDQRDRLSESANLVRTVVIDSPVSPPASGARPKRGPANVDHIIAATASDRFKPPADIDKAALRHDIESAASRGRVIVAASNKKEWRERRARMAAIALAAERLHGMFVDGPGSWCLGRMSSNFPLHEGAVQADGHEDLAPSANGFRLGLERCSQTARKELQTKGLSGTPLLDGQGSLGEWMIRVGLKKVFEKWFRVKASVGRSLPADDPYAVDEIANSPYTSFVLAVLNDLGIRSQRRKPYSRETVVREASRKAPRGMKARVRPVGQFSANAQKLPVFPRPALPLIHRRHPRPPARG